MPQRDFLKVSTNSAGPEDAHSGCMITSFDHGPLFSI